MGSPDITVLLRRASDGDEQAHRDLLAQVYEELRSLAASQLRHDGELRSLSATALVHEAWIRLTPSDGAARAWANRRHFFGAAAEAMRRVLIDQARRRRTQKRDAARLPLDVQFIESVESQASVDILDLHEALLAFETADPQAASVLKLRYFAGLQLPEISEVLGVSRATVVRDLTFAKSWLKSRLDDTDVELPS